MDRTACTEPQCLYSTAIPLLPLWTVRPVHSLSACTVQLHLYSPYWPYSLYRASVPVHYSYTSTPPIGRTACTLPQCLYSTAIPLLPLWATPNLERDHFTFRPLHVSDRFTVHHQESSTVHAAIRICHTGNADCLLARLGLNSTLIPLASYCCVYSTRLLMMNGKPVRNI
jgi:hypothetical protein